MGGRERSFLTGSGFVGGAAGLLVVGRLWRVGSALLGMELAVGCRIEGLLAMLLELGGRPYREVGLAVVDLTVGSRLVGELLFPSPTAGRAAAILSDCSAGVDLAAALEFPYLLPMSEGLRNDRVRAGIVDILRDGITINFVDLMALFIVSVEFRLETALWREGPGSIDTRHTSTPHLLRHRLNLEASLHLLPHDGIVSSTTTCMR